MDMQSESITSRNNPRIKHLRRLLDDRDARYESGQYIVEGLRAVQAAAPIGELYVEEGRPVPEIAAEKIYVVAPHAFEAIAGTENSQGVIGLAALRVRDAAELKPDARYVLLDRLQDPGNMGSIIRTAAAFGYGGIIVTSGTVDPFSPKVVRSTAGYLSRLEVFRLGDPEELAPLTVIAADAAGTDIRSFAWPDHFVLAVGNEGAGISQEIRALARRTVRIGMTEGVESLNAAVAAGILLYAASRG